MLSRWDSWSFPVVNQAVVVRGKYSIFGVYHVLLVALRLGLCVWLTEHDLMTSGSQTRARERANHGLRGQRTPTPGRAIVRCEALVSVPLRSHSVPYVMGRP